MVLLLVNLSFTRETQYNFVALLIWSVNSRFLEYGQLLVFLIKHLHTELENEYLCSPFMANSFLHAAKVVISPFRTGLFPT